MQMTHRRLAALAALFGAIMLASCAAQRPVLYPNAKLEAGGRASADADIAACQEMATSAGATNEPGKRIAKETAKTAAIGGATGAVAGAVAGGNAGRGAAIGAAGGATARLVQGLFESDEVDPIYRQFVNTCLAERGYRVIGWR